MTQNELNRFPGRRENFDSPDSPNSPNLPDFTASGPRFYLRLSFIFKKLKMAGTLLSSAVQMLICCAIHGHLTDLYSQTSADRLAA
jgi:hypothetical protein